MDTKNSTEVIGITEGQYSFSKRYNESFVAMKTNNSEDLKKVLDYLHKMKFMFYVETKHSGQSSSYAVSVKMNEEPMGKLRDLFDFMQKFENPRITTTEELARTQ